MLNYKLDLLILKCLKEIKYPSENSMYIDKIIKDIIEVIKINETKDLIIYFSFNQVL